MEGLDSFHLSELPLLGNWFFSQTLMVPRWLLKFQASYGDTKTFRVRRGWKALLVSPTHSWEACLECGGLVPSIHVKSLLICLLPEGVRRRKTPLQTGSALCLGLSNQMHSYKIWMTGGHEVETTLLLALPSWKGTLFCDGLSDHSHFPFFFF